MFWLIVRFSVCSSWQEPRSGGGTWEMLLGTLEGTLVGWSFKTTFFSEPVYHFDWNKKKSPYSFSCLVLPVLSSAKHEKTIHIIPHTGCEVFIYNTAPTMQHHHHHHHRFQLVSRLFIWNFQHSYDFCSIGTIFSHVWFIYIYHNLLPNLPSITSAVPEMRHLYEVQNFAQTEDLF